MSDATLCSDLRQAIDAHGARVALSDAKGELTYRALGERVERVARSLASRGVRKGARVALLSARSADASATFHAIMAAGAAVVPLAPGGPASRQATILSSAGAEHLVHDEACAAQAKALAAHVPNLQLLGADELAQPPERGERPALPAPSDLAYIIYTSGSTGTPKGVAYDHGAARLFPAWAREAHGLGPSDRVAALAPLHFDLATYDLFAALSSGASVHVPPHEALLFPRALGAWLVERVITVMYAVPSLYTALADKGDLAPGALGALRTLLFAGEVFAIPALCRVARLAPGAALENLYGPTETNVCTAHRLERAPREGDGPLPIGRVLPFFEGVLREPDEDGIGELILEGPGVMRGYWGQTDTGTPRRHATGDYVSRDADGSWVFHGRRDRMVKLRGHRVELGEVEHAIALSGLVSEVAAVTRGEGTQRELVAYYAAETDPGARALKTALSRALPHYMMPHEFRYVPALPRTSTGKVALDELASLTRQSA